MSKAVCIVGAGAVSPQGFDLISCDHRLQRFPPEPDHCSTANTLHYPGNPGQPESGLEVLHIPPEQDAGDKRSRKLMSRGARLAAIAIRQTLKDTTWTDCDQVGLFMGVGSSSASIKDLTSVLRASYQDGQLDMELLGSKGLRSFNPLHTFMLLPNFSMCHSALIEGITGPNGVYFSRGTGTIAALMEAKHSVESGTCARALCGGADSALHPLSAAELIRDGYIGNGLVPSEGAGMLALEVSSGVKDEILVNAVSIHPTRKHGLSTAVKKALDTISPVDSCLLMPWGDEARKTLASVSEATWPDANITDLSAFLGESLAASPALAWTAAIAMLRIQPGRIATLSAGIDGDLGIVVFSRGEHS